MRSNCKQAANARKEYGKRFDTRCSLDVQVRLLLSLVIIEIGRRTILVRLSAGLQKHSIPTAKRDLIEAISILKDAPGGRHTTTGTPALVVLEVHVLPIAKNLRTIVLCTCQNCSKTALFL